MILTRRSLWLSAEVIVLLVCTITAAFMVGRPVGNIKAKAAAALNPFVVPNPQGNGYTYRRIITIDHTKVANTDQSNFPVLISGTYSYLATAANGGNVQNSNGYDVIFTSDSSCSAKLNHEVETYNSTTGAVNYWVKVPTLSHSTDTALYMCYGNAGINTDQSNKLAVWDANFKAVWHVPNGSTLNSTDSTANHNLTNSSVVATAGVVGGGASFDGSTQYLSSATHADFSWANLRTVEFWMKLGNTTQVLPRLFSNSDGGSDGWSITWIDPPSVASLGLAGKFLVASIGTQATPSVQRRTPDNGTINATDVWHHVAVIGDGTSVAAIYLDGSPVTVSNYISNITNTTTTGLNIGRRNNDGRYYNGKLDELRLSNAQRSADWIKTEYNNQNSPATFYTVSSTSSDYTYRRSITIDHTKVPNSDQSNFPLLIKGTYAYLAPVAYGGNVQNINGYDVIFASDPGCASQLNHEVESYDAATGAVNYWVKVPLVSHSNDTLIYLCYGSASVTTDQSNKAGVWDANYKGIYHLPNGTILSGADSTANANNGTKGSLSATATVGQIGGGMILGGVDFANEHIQVATNAGLRAGTITVSAWVKTTDASGNRYALTEDNSVTRNWRLRQTATQFQFSTIDTGGNEIITGSATNFSLNAWHYLVGVRDGATGTAKLYVDGSNTATNSSLGALNTGAVDMHIGQKGDGGLPWKGSLDEVRYSNAARSADWIATEYNNQNLPSTFYSVSASSGGPNQPPVANPGGPYATPTNTAMQFNATGSSDPDGTIANYSWSFGDGTSGSGATPTHTYASANTYTATVTVTDNVGATNTNSVSVLVQSPDPQFSTVQIHPGNVSVLTGDHVQFAAVAFDSNNVPVGGINYFWQTNYQGQDGKVTISQKGEFSAAIAGVYLVAAQGNGHVGQVTVTVADRCSANCGESLQIGESSGWNPGNYDSSNDPINSRGNPLGRSVEGNDNFQLAVPILHLPGRGLDLDLTLRYNSRVWSKSGNQMIFDADNDWPAPGWSFGFGKMINMPEAGIVFLIDGDGTRHSFKGDTHRGLSEYAFIGETTDGTFIKYYCRTARDPYTGMLGATDAVVKYPNGTTTYFQSNTLVSASGSFLMRPIQISDQNGNYITITYKDATQRIKSIVDTLGRAVLFTYDPSDRLTAVTQASFQNALPFHEPRTVARFHYRSLTLSPDLFSVNVQAPSGAISLIDGIFFPSAPLPIFYGQPATPGDGYWFGDTDSYSPYGMLQKVVVQHGMGFTIQQNPFNTAQQGTFSPGTMLLQQVYAYPPTAQFLTTAPTFASSTDSWFGMDTDPVTTLYAVDNNSSPRTTTITRPDNTKIVRLAYNYSQLPNTNPLKLLDGRVYQEEFKDAAGTVLRRSITGWENGFRNAPRITRIEGSEIENGQTLTRASVLDYQGGTYNQVAESRDYGFDGALMHTTKTTYSIKNDVELDYTTYNIYDYYTLLAPRLLYLPMSVELLAADNVSASFTQYGYDEGQLQNVYGLANQPYYPSPENVTNHDRAFDPYAWACCGWYKVTGGRGNLTSVTKYTDAANRSGALTDHLIYDLTGNVVTQTSAGGLSQTFSYTQETQNAYCVASTFGSLSDLTKQQKQTTSYDFNTGLVVSSRDSNGLQKSVSYTPQTQRIKESISPTGARTTYDYDAGVFDITETILSSTNAVAGKTVQYFNGLGQVKKSQSLAVLGTSEATNVWETSDSVYDQFGRPTQVSRPYRNGDSPQFAHISYDVRGRKTAELDALWYGLTLSYNEASRPSGASSEAGETNKVTDAWGRWRWSRFDSNGRLAEVVEPNPAGGTGFSTKYNYDAVGHLLKTEQGDQIRRFRYDSLGRLTQQKLAEAAATLNSAGEKAISEPADQRWSEVFTYDNRSNLVSRTDARGVKTLFSYHDSGGNDDPLNRMLSVTYDTSRVDSSLTVLAAPSITYQYEEQSAPQIVDITRIKQVQANGVSSEQYTYDSQGRLQERKLTLAGRAKAMTVTYDYDSLSRITQTTYPEQYHDDVTNPIRKVVKTSYDVASRATGLKVNDVDYASQINYNADGQVTAIGVGSGANQLTENYSYNPATGRLLNQNVKRGATTLMSLGFDYRKEYCEQEGCTTQGEPDPTLSQTGQLTKMTNLLSGKWHHYLYDALGRLVNAEQLQEVFGQYGFEPKITWSQAYSYDRYGNRTGVAASSDTGLSPIPLDGAPSLSYDIASNRITTAGFSYDAAGNQLQNGTGKSFVYDAAGRLVQVRNQSNNVIATYTYGASNRRLISQNGDQNSSDKTYYLWGGDAVLTEYSDPGNSTIMPTWSKNYLYFGDGLLATEEPKTGGGELVSYHHPDGLGTRLVTNNADTTSLEQVSLPFGTALDSGATNRRFTSYDRSAATLLDYALNRHYDSQQGRFTQVDPIAMSAVALSNPQSLNLYAYCGNDPINMIDPSGTWGISATFRGFGSFGGDGRGGGSGSFFGGLFNFFSGLFGSIFHQGNRTFQGVSASLGATTAPKVIPVPGPATSTATVAFNVPQDNWMDKDPGALGDWNKDCNILVEFKGTSRLGGRIENGPGETTEGGDGLGFGFTVSGGVTRGRIGRVVTADGTDTVDKKGAWTLRQIVSYYGVSTRSIFPDTDIKEAAGPKEDGPRWAFRAVGKRNFAYIDFPGPPRKTRLGTILTHHSEFDFTVLLSDGTAQCLVSFNVVMSLQSGRMVATWRSR